MKESRHKSLFGHSQALAQPSLVGRNLFKDVAQKAAIGEQRATKEPQAPSPFQLVAQDTYPIYKKLPRLPQKCHPEPAACENRTLKKTLPYPISLNNYVVEKHKTEELSGSSPFFVCVLEEKDTLTVVFVSIHCLAEQRIRNTAIPFQ